MKVVMLCGSPRGAKGNSAYLLDGLGRLLGDRVSCETVRVTPGPSAANEDTAAKVAGCDALVMAFPLYVDGVPAGLHEALARFGERVREAGTSPRVYAVVNCGFFEARQNGLAIEMIWSWCEANGLARGRAVAVGGGEMCRAAPLGHGPAKDLGRALAQLADDVAAGRAGDALCAQPNFPRILYRLGARFLWRKQAKANGLSPRALKRRPANL